ncbi:hypothetical protein I6F65_05085 [Pseudoalteromonas sp. SWXJZ94C]|uniref:tetratricopeptide repeat protein n=1 Tax=unclassified Pseudoalteromonas TaxID=194690 RepID=UPI0003FF9E95|nr:MULTISPECIES: hypothetical protein [unclassified Pseudoalteromonas]MBH0056326.1 hypothetical protein [Pseudoalteromonas sp. SWXJZ94C]
MKIFYVILLLTLSGCAHIDYKPSVNPYSALGDLVNKYQLNTQQLKCEGINASNCLTLVHELNQLMLEHPGNTAILSIAAYSFYKSGRANQAQQVINTLLNKPNPPLNAITLGISLAIEQGNLAKAKSIAQYGIDVFGTQSSPYLQMASIHYAQGSYVIASNYLELAAKFGLKNTIYFYHKGLIEEGNANNLLACNYYEQVLSVEPEHKKALARRGKLSILGNCYS